MFLVIGICVIGLSVFLYRDGRLPDDAVIVPAIVVDIRSKKLHHESNRLSYGPVVEFTAPTSGVRERLEPRNFGSRDRSIGDAAQVTQVARRPSTGQVRLVDTSGRQRRTITVAGIGIATSLVQVLIWFR